MPRGRPRKPKSEGRAPSRAPAGVPSCPEFLSPIAKKKWKDLVKHLKLAGVLMHVDGDTIARYCVVYATWYKANEMVQKAGEVYLGPNSGFVQNPWLSIRKAASQEMQKISPQLGLDPRSRKLLDIDATAPPVDDKAKFFKAREGT